MTSVSLPPTKPFRLSHHADFPGSIVIPDWTVASFNSRVGRFDAGCWIYQPLPKTFRIGVGAVLDPNPNRYFQISWTDQWGFKQHIAAHRLALLQHVGPIPSGLYACHLCATPACMNPAHLYAGTGKQNSDDRWLMEAIRRRRGSTEGVVLPRHPRSRIVCEALINGNDAEQPREKRYG